MIAARWVVLTVHVEGAEGTEETVGIVGEVLLASGAGAVEELEDGLRTWLREPESVVDLVAEIRGRLADALPGVRLEIRSELRTEENWLENWRRSLVPRRVGRRFIVAPTWTRPETGPDDIVILLDPQMAFGTAEHASTRGALRLLERVVRPGMRVLDVGTGSGILAIAAARAGARVEAVDSDADAMPNAQQNVDQNGVAERVRIGHASVDDAFLSRAGPCDVIIANVLSGVLQPLLQSFGCALAPEGALITAGILTGEAAGFREAARAAGLDFVAEDVEDGWWAGLFQASPSPFIPGIAV